MANIDWSTLLENDNVLNAWIKFTSVLQETVVQCISTARRRANVKTHKPKWWANEIETGISQKKHAHQKYKLTNNENDRLQFERIRRHTKKLIRQNKRKLEVYIASTAKDNPKRIL